MAKLGRFSLWMAGVLFCAYILTRLSGYADHEPLTLPGLSGGVRPSAFHGLADSLLLFSIAFALYEVLALLRCEKTKAPEPPTQQ